MPFIRRINELDPNNVADSNTNPVVPDHTVIDNGSIGLLCKPTVQRKDNEGVAQVNTQEQIHYNIKELSCRCVFRTNKMPIYIPTEDYMKRFENSNEWYEQFFIIGHCQLLFHTHHLPDVQLVNVLNSNATVTGKDVAQLDEGVKRVYSILHGENHYVVLEIFVETKVVQIIDGLEKSLHVWCSAVKNVLTMIGKVPLSCTAKFVDKDETRNSPCMELHVGNGDVWCLHRPKPFFKQTDGHNCGPIALLKIMSVFNRVPEGNDLQRMTSKQI